MGWWGFVLAPWWRAYCRGCVFPDIDWQSFWIRVRLLYAAAVRMYVSVSVCNWDTITEKLFSLWLNGDTLSLYSSSAFFACPIFSSRRTKICALWLSPPFSASQFRLFPFESLSVAVHDRVDLSTVPVVLYSVLIWSTFWTTGESGRNLVFLTKSACVWKIESTLGGWHFGYE